VVLAREMYDLVTAVEDYPQFLPWCDKAEVLERHADGVTARLGLAYMGVRHAFTTRNQHARARVGDGAPGRRAVLAARRHLAVPAHLGRPGSDQPACKVEFDLRYAFSSRRWRRWSARCSTAWPTPSSTPSCKRAEQVYGAR
jgi:ribosome-associated toxin RatA of RatAB toxin-antitoxin module